MRSASVWGLAAAAAALPVVAYLVIGAWGAGEPADMQQGTPSVSIVTVQPETLPITTELPGRVAPLQVAEVRPKVSGIVLKRVFQQGSLVKQGDVLYQIDPEPFQVQVASADAAVQRAEAVLVQARDMAERARRLRERKVSSGQDYDNAVAALSQAEADVAQAKANAQGARIDLANAEVKAPISGRIGRAIVTEGALVSSSDVQPLATIHQLDMVYADFTQSAGDLMKLRHGVKSGAIRSAAPGEAKVTLIFDDGTPYPHAGRLLFSEVFVNSDTGQVTLRGEFPNADGDLLPGLYIRGAVEQGEQEAIAVPQQAVQRDTAGRPQLFVVAGDKVELRPVTLGRALENRWVVQTGLKGGERIVVEGFQKIRPGDTVVAQDWAPRSQQVAADGES